MSTNYQGISLKTSMAWKNYPSRLGAMKNRNENDTFLIVASYERSFGGRADVKKKKKTFDVSRLVNGSTD